MTTVLTKKMISGAIVAYMATMGAAHAATITTASISIDSPGGGSFSDSATAIDADSTIGDTFGPASATQNVDGSSTVSAAASTPFAGGREVVIATAELAQEAQNNTGATVGYSFSFSLFDLALQAQETYGYSPYTDYSNPFENASSDAAANKISYDILLNGTSIYTASAELFGGIDAGWTVANVENFTFTEEDITDGTDVIGKRVVLDDVMETLFLGNYEDGEGLQLTTILRAESQATNFEGEQFAGAFFGDPSGLAGNGLVTQVAPQNVNPNPSAVPLPAAGWMLLAGFGGLAAMKRRKKV